METAPPTALLPSPRVIDFAITEASRANDWSTLNITTIQAATSPSREIRSSTPPEALPEGLHTLLEELSFVLICATGQLLFAIYLAVVYVDQIALTSALALERTYTPWLIGSFLVANGVSVVLSGSLADLTNPKFMTILALAWCSVWNLIGVFAITPERKILFFFVQAMIGLAVGTLCSAAMSMLGRVYHPGVRKNRVFASLGAMIDVGFAIGAVLAGALSRHLRWIYATMAIFTAICAGLALWCIPSGQTKSHSGLSMKDFDFLGGVVGVSGCGLLIFGLTQGAPAEWSPYTYVTIIVGIGCFFAFYLVEKRARRPLIDNRLWKTPGFLPLMAAYLLAYGAFVGGCLFYACRFFLTIHKEAPITAGLFLLPIGLFGSLSAILVSKTMHILPGHFILVGSMVAFSAGPAMFLPQNSNTLYWALSFPALVIGAFGPDMSFAAISVFITSSVPRSFQGSAGSLLITAQNLSSAVFAALGDTIAEQTTDSSGAELDLHALRNVWWLSLASCLAGTLVCAVFVRIPKSEEREHVE